MATAFLVEIPGVTEEEYEKVTRKVNEAGSPAGCIFHGGGPYEGGVRLVEVWDSPEAAQAFYSSQVFRDATAAAGGGAGRQQPKVLMTWPVRGIDDGTGWRRIG
jgi:hypothetical protein